EPEFDEDVTPELLPRQIRRGLRTLSRGNADHVACHLIMARRLYDLDPEAAYRHTRTAVRHASRVDVVREANALTAYRTERYGEALREIRTVRRLSGRDELRAVEADCERGLGRPFRALEVLAAAPATQDAAAGVEQQIVASGARSDLGEHEAALLLIDEALYDTREANLRQRLTEVR